MRKAPSAVHSSMQVIRNLPVYLASSYRRQGTAPKDYAMNRCLKHIERITRTRDFSNKKNLSWDKRELLKEAWGIYFKLQDFNNSERQDYNPTRESCIHDIPPDEMEELDIILQGSPVDVDGPEIYAGGLGYRHMNWDSAFFMAKPVGHKRHNPYWQPERPRNKVGTPEHKAMISLEESGYWACKPKEPDAWDKLVESSHR